MSRRGLLGAASGALVLARGAAEPPGRRRDRRKGAGAIAAKPGTRVPAFLEIRGDGTIRFLSPFVEGGQGIATGMAQIVGEELDVHPSRFVVECAPPGADYAVVNGIRMTGGSLSTRSSYPLMRQLGATARDMLIRAAAARLKVQDGELSTEDGTVRHPASGRSLTYAELAAAGARTEAERGGPTARPRHASATSASRSLGSTSATSRRDGRSTRIDLRVDGMLLAAVQHAPHAGTEPVTLENEADVKRCRACRASTACPAPWR